jgi:hypothetical protein
MDSQEPIPQEWIEVVHATYFLGFDPGQYFEPLERRLKHVPDAFIPSRNAFRNNLEALIAVVSMPILLASSTATGMRFQRILKAERIRRLKRDVPQLSAADEEEAHRLARKKLEGELATTEGIRQAGEEAWRFLHSGLLTDEMASAARELLRQGTVLCWGALEVLAREVFVAYINANPKMARMLIEHPGTKGRFDLKAISVEVLETHGFDVSSRMGNVLMQYQDLADLGAIKDIYRVLFPDAPGLHPALGERDLWILNQRRHLIAHKRGIVDARYLERTGETAAVGTVLNISPVELKEYLRLVRDAGTEILGATNSGIPSPV